MSEIKVYRFDPSKDELSLHLTVDKLEPDFFDKEIGIAYTSGVGQEFIDESTKSGEFFFTTRPYLSKIMVTYHSTMEGLKQDILASYMTYNLTN